MFLKKQALRVDKILVDWSHLTGRFDRFCNYTSFKFQTKLNYWFCWNTGEIGMILQNQELVDWSHWFSSLYVLQWEILTDFVCAKYQTCMHNYILVYVNHSEVSVSSCCRAILPNLARLGPVIKIKTNSMCTHAIFIVFFKF